MLMVLKIMSFSCLDSAVGDWEADPTNSRADSKRAWLGVVRQIYSHYFDCSRFKRMVSANTAHYHVDPVAYTFTSE